MKTVVLYNIATNLASVTHTQVINADLAIDKMSTNQSIVCVHTTH